MEKKSAYDLIEIIGKLWPLVLIVVFQNRLFDELFG